MAGVQAAAPARLGPEHAEYVYSTLMTALVNDPHHPGAREAAEGVLRSFEAVYGFSDVLCQVIAR
jgi:hypothetical protein